MKFVDGALKIYDTSDNLVYSADNIEVKIMSTSYEYVHIITINSYCPQDDFMTVKTLYNNEQLKNIEVFLFGRFLNINIKQLIYSWEANVWCMMEDDNHVGMILSFLYKSNVNGRL